MRPAILLFFMFILSACASVDDSKKTITLGNATRQYERAIRWGEFQSAESLRKPSSASSSDTARFRTVRVTSYEPVRKTESADRSEVQIDVQIRYYNESNMKEVTIIDHQYWKYDPVGKSWYITSPMPAFK